METKCWTVDEAVDISKAYPQIAQAAKLLKENEVVAFPTETVYGLGANAFSDEAVQKIYEAKGRPSDNPLIVHISSEDQINEIATDVPDYATTLINSFWPGPLTLVLNKKGGLSTFVTAGLDTVAVRMPDHLLALALIKEAGIPVAAPSANLSGKPSPTRAEHVLNDLDGKIAGIVNGGPTGVGLESTVLDCSGATPVILRPGGITKEQLQSVIGHVEVDPVLEDTNSSPKSPGMKYTHYAPNAPLVVVDGSLMFIQTLIKKAQANGKKVGVLTTEEAKRSYVADTILACGQRVNIETVATQLYSVLREFDEHDVDVIFSESFPTAGMGQAVMNRLLKAAGHQIINEK
ncbi:L-threonylcarbamoyladenylate synthase [Metabacillus herbersteinensis]|uniref:Threonylcarbamoyl-AMP synthase n=1 Tax=Metabacillus herbersteinensis TaxID=283816 RepID=A0ABV6GFV4_9BACI